MNINSNRSIRSNTNIGGRASPNFETAKPLSFTNRPSSPTLPLSNNRLSSIRLQDSNKSESPTKNFNDDDVKYHKIVFERCADPSDRVSITNREKFVQGDFIYF
jgi:hypothetical protein